MRAIRAKNIVLHMNQYNLTYEKMSKKLGVSRQVLFYHIKKAGLTSYKKRKQKPMLEDTGKDRFSNRLRQLNPHDEDYHKLVLDVLIEAIDYLPRLKFKNLINLIKYE